MSFWRPAYEWRGTRKHWLDSPIMRSLILQGSAAMIVAQAVLMPAMVREADNDTDAKRW